MKYIKPIFCVLLAAVFAIGLAACKTKTDNEDISSVNTSDSFSEESSAITSGSEDSDTPSSSDALSASEGSESTAVQSGSSEKQSSVGNTTASKQGAAISSEAKPSQSSSKSQMSQSSNSSQSQPQTSSTSTSPARECVNRPDLATQLLKKINAYRQANGVAELTDTSRNSGFAYNQAWYNAVNDVPRKSAHSPYQIGASGTLYTVSADQIPSRAFNAWKDSSGHNANMLDAESDRAGIAVIEIKKNGVTAEYVAIVDFDYVGWESHEDTGIYK